jgi:hypothetical protein
MNNRLIHDSAYAAAVSLLQSFSPCLREEEHKDAFDVAYETVKAAIEAYEIQTNRLEERLRPGKN